MKELSDIDLWEAIRNDDTKAFETLFDRYFSKLYATAFHHLKDGEVCADITHDIFLNLWLKRDRLDIHSFPAYLQASVRYHVYRYKKSLKAVPVQYPAEWEQVAEKSTGLAVDFDLRYKEMEGCVNSYLNQLPARCKQIFLLSRKEQFSNDEIASQLSISKRTVENQLTHALRHLRLSLKKLY